MTNFKTRAALIALIAAAPMAVFADIETGSPAQSVASDPDEYAAPDNGVKTTGSSMENTAKADQGENAYDDAEVVEDLDGSLIEDSAKSDS